MLYVGCQAVLGGVLGDFLEIIFFALLLLFTWLSFMGVWGFRVFSGGGLLLLEAGRSDLNHSGISHANF